MNIFIAFADQDRDVRNNLLRQMDLVKDSQGWNIWSSKEILAGEDWDAEIKQRLMDSQVVILLLSADFLTSKYILEKELPQAVEKHKRGDCLIIPVIARVCHWKDTPFGKYAQLGDIQALPVGEKPIMSKKHWDNDDEPYFEVVEGMKEAIRTFQAKKKEGAEAAEHERLALEKQKQEAAQREREAQVRNKQDDADRIAAEQRSREDHIWRDREDQGARDREGNDINYGIVVDNTSSIKGDLNQKSFWQRPEGLTGGLFLIGLVVFCGYALYAGLPILFTLASNTISLIAMLVFLVVMVFILINPMTWKVFKSSMLWITKLLIK